MDSKHREIFDHFTVMEVGDYNYICSTPLDWNGQIDFPENTELGIIYISKLSGKKITIDIHPSGLNALCVICEDCKDIKLQFSENEKTPNMIFFASKNSKVLFNLPQTLRTLVTSLQNSNVTYANIESIGIVESCWDEKSILRVPFVNNQVEKYVNKHGGNSQNGMLTLPVYSFSIEENAFFEYSIDGVKFAKQSKNYRFENTNKRAPVHITDNGVPCRSPK